MVSTQFTKLLHLLFRDIWKVASTIQYQLALRMTICTSNQQQKMQLSSDYDEFSKL